MEGLQLILASEANVHLVATAANGLETLDILEKEKVDIVFLDINMPVLNGIETMKQIKQKHPTTKVIGLSMMDEVNIIKQFMGLGARGFLLKNSGKAIILESISKVMTGQIFYDPSILQRIIDTPTKRRQRQSLFPKLSRREKEILGFMINELTTQEIANKLFISFGTVETHRRNIINKLGVRNTAGLVRVSLEYGLLNE